MKRRAILASLAAGSLLGAGFARALPAAGVRRLDFLFPWPGDDRCEESMKKIDGKGVVNGLARLGHVEGRNLAVEWHCFGTDFARGPRVARDVVHRGVDVLATGGTAATRVLQAATKTIPILTIANDPVRSGFTRSLVRPDGNVTGFCNTHPDTPAKEIELLRRMMPILKHLVIIGDAGYPGMRELMRPGETAAIAAGLVPDVKLVNPSGFDRVFTEMKGDRSQAVLLNLPGWGLYGEIAKLALRHGVATLANGYGYVELGGLMSFIMSHRNLVLRRVAMLDKLLRGIKPADIPWELPDRSHFAINLRTAKALGLAVPTDLLLRADQVVE